jgi:hypothetical protein
MFQKRNAAIQVQGAAKPAQALEFRTNPYDPQHGLAFQPLHGTQQRGHILARVEVRNAQDAGLRTTLPRKLPQRGLPVCQID